MAQLGNTFRPEDAPEGDEFAPFPAGDYLAHVIESDVGPTKKGDGTILKLVLEVLSGPQKGRRVWDRLNISNPNPKAQGIAQRALADLCTAVGLPAVNDSEELHFKPMTIRVAVTQDPGYAPKNEVKKYLPPNGQAGASATPSRPSPQAEGAHQQAAAPARTAASGGARPWK